MSADDTIEFHIDMICSNLEKALGAAQYLQQFVLDNEGDNDLHRKLACYLTPNLSHWIEGTQAGNIKDLKETLARRFAIQETNMLQSQSGDGHDVVTKPSA